MSASATRSPPSVIINNSGTANSVSNTHSAVPTPRQHETAVATAHMADRGDVGTTASHTPSHTAAPHNLQHPAAHSARPSSSSQ
jgi:hypothetical protein